MPIYRVYSQVFDLMLHVLLLSWLIIWDKFVFLKKKIGDYFYIYSLEIKFDI